MALRWLGAGIIEANKEFRRLKAHKHLSVLRVALPRSHHIKPVAYVANKAQLRDAKDYLSSRRLGYRYSRTLDSLPPSPLLRVSEIDVENGSGAISGLARLQPPGTLQ